MNAGDGKTQDGAMHVVSGSGDTAGNVVVRSGAGTSVGGSVRVTGWDSTTASDPLVWQTALH